MAFPLLPALLVLGGGSALYMLHRRQSQTLPVGGETSQEIHDFINALKLGQVPPMMSLLGSLRNKYGRQSFLGEALGETVSDVISRKPGPVIKGIATNPSTLALRLGASSLWSMAYDERTLPLDVLGRYADFFRAEGLPSVATYLTTPP